MPQNAPSVRILDSDGADIRTSQFGASGAATETTLASVLSELVSILTQLQSAQYQDGATTSPASGTLGMAVVGEARAPYTDGELRPVHVDTQGQLLVVAGPRATTLDVFGVDDANVFHPWTSWPIPDTPWDHRGADT